MKVVLADSHGPIVGKDQTSASLSLLYLGSYLREMADFDVDLRYIPQAKSDRFHIDTVRSFRPDIYAVSFTSYSALITYTLIKEIKQKFPQVLVVCGGSHVIDKSREVLEKSGADLCVIGEGEQTFFEIASNFNRITEARKDIKGIAYLENSEYKRNIPRKLIDDINTIPFPLRYLVNDDDFCGLSYRKSRPNTEMVVARGCPYRCVFCANPVFRLKNGPPYRTRSPENIAEEAEQLYQLGYREIYIHSDELNIKLNWSIDVCKALAALGHKDLYFQCNLRALPMSEELADWLKRANFWLIRLGIESSSERVLSGIKKQMSFEKTERACRLLSAQGIKVLGFVMLFNIWEEDGVLKHETSQEVRQTIKDMYRLWRKGHLNYTSWGPPVPIQGSELYDIAIRHGLVDQNYYPSDTWNVYDSLEGVSKNEYNRVLAAARRQQALLILASGNIEWRNYRGIIRKVWSMFRGIPELDATKNSATINAKSRSAT